MRLALVLLATVLLFPSIGLAFDEEEYIGLNTYIEVKGGQFKATGDLVERNAPNGSNFEIALGHRFLNYFALEAGYGSYKVEGDLQPGYFYDPIYGTVYMTGHDIFKVNPLLVTVKLMYPVEEGFVYLGGGYGRYTVNFEANRQFSGSFGKIKDKYKDTDTVNGWHFVLGTMLDWNEWSIGFEYKEAKTEKAEFEDELFGAMLPYETDVSGRILSGFLQLRF